MTSTTKMKTSPAKQINMTMGLREWVLIITLSILWGGSFFFVGVAVKELPPLTIVLFRVTLAAVILLIWMQVKGATLPSSPKLWGAFLVMGALNNVIPFSLIVWGQTQIASGLASILNGTTPMFSVVLAHFLTKEERLTLHRFAGIAIGWIGVVAIIGAGTLQNNGTELPGQLAILSAALSYALAAIYGRRFQGQNPLVVATGMLCCSACIMAPLALYTEQPWQHFPSAFTWMALFGLASISTALAYIIYFRVLARSGATNLLLVTLLIPLSAVLLGALILGEQLGWSALAGMALIGTGLVAIDGRMLTGLKRKM